jgi:hypothetical protein
VDQINFLKIAYGANIIILAPVVYNMLFGSGVAQVFEGQVNESAGLRIMVGSLWAAIMLASLAGFWMPRFLAPVLLIQIFYKALWLGLFVLPILQTAGWNAIPKGISLVFLGIVVSYPFLFWAAMRG